MTHSDRTTRRDFLMKVAGLGALASRPGRALAGTTAGFTGARISSAQQTMPTRAIPVSGEEIPIIGFGSSKAVLEIPAEGTEPVENVIRTLLEYGGRVVDTSPRTPEIDRQFGRILQEPGIRDEIFLAAKIYIEGEAEGIAQMRQNQRLFGRETLDLVQIESLRDLETHWPSLQRWKDSGEARYIGVTVFLNRQHEELEAFMRRESPDFVHMNYSVIERQAEERLLPLAQDRGMAVIINRPFMNGRYFSLVEGRELPEWAADFGCEAWSQFSLKYILANPAVTCVLTETTNPEHMDENIQAAFGRVPDEAERQRMVELVQSF